MHLVSSAALSLSVFSAYHFVADEIKMRNDLNPGESPYGQDYLKRHVSNICWILLHLWSFFSKSLRPEVREYQLRKFSGGLVVGGFCWSIAS